MYKTLTPHELDKLLLAYILESEGAGYTQELPGGGDENQLPRKFYGKIKKAS